jgi:hypothetical protein
MRPLPPPESSGEIVLDWLHEEGWSLSHTTTNGVWEVTGVNGERIVKAQGATLEEAWMKATALTRTA